MLWLQFSRPACEWLGLNWAVCGLGILLILILFCDLGEKTTCSANG